MSRQAPPAGHDAGATPAPAAKHLTIVVAALPGYFFAKFGARYPSAGGLLDYVARPRPGQVPADTGS